MKCSESWLREWVNPSLSREKIAERLTMAGLEVESCSPVAEEISGVVVGQILKIEPHPSADRLHICEVNVGNPTLLKIVCGATNVAVDMKVPVAMVGATLPNNLAIATTEIRGVVSQGMLCSARELGLAEESDGLFILSPDATIGMNLQDYLQLNDYLFDISITPNRGDCLSVRGLAREISALTATPLTHPLKMDEFEATYNVIFTVAVEAKADCPSYSGRVIRNVNVNADTPIWLKERLRRSGIRSISAVVDITNYVMLELGQPMHAFDLDKIQQGIQVRHAKKGELIHLLDGAEITLVQGTLVIADARKPLAIAGVMGGVESSVTADTNHVFLESAFFQPEVVAKSRQQYHLASESAYRFERGVDPTIQREAIIRATQLILEIAGGEVGPVIEVVHPEVMPKPHLMKLAVQNVTDLLGVQIDEQSIESILKALGFVFKREESTFFIRVPIYRFDITLPEDVIEEIARLYGYQQIPTHAITGVLRPIHPVEVAHDWQRIKEQISDLGYHEVITYSFIDQTLQSLFDPIHSPCPLTNPITSDMSVMRTNLWPGLINAFLYNQSRQQNRIRLFEMGTCFIRQGKQLLQEMRFGGLIAGLIHPEQWAVPTREVDFFDLKGDVETLLFEMGVLSEVDFKLEQHSVLHPGQTAGIYYQNKRIGVIGAIHPRILQQLDINSRVFVFELNVDNIKRSKSKHIEAISKYPEIRRDLAILIKEAIPAHQIQDTIKLSAGDWLKDVFIFDVYKGKGISPGLKSVALALVWQHPTRTLIDEEVNEFVNRVTATLNDELGAELRR